MLDHHGPQLGWLQDLCTPAPAQHPLQDFIQAIHGESQRHAAILVRLDNLLGAMPIAWAQLTPARQTRAVGDEPLKDLAEWILRSPRAERLTSRDDALIAQIVLRQEGPARRTIYVRRKGSGETDVVFIVVTPSEETYYYHASVSGKLVKAAVVHGTVDSIATQAALNAFRHERDFWLN